MAENSMCTRLIMSLCGRTVIARFLRDECGSYLVLATLLLPALLGIAGLGAEGTFWLYNHRVVQSAADNAAYSVATARAINSAATSADLTLQAKAVAANDYNLVDGVNGATVTLNRPPTGACFNGTSKYVGAANAAEVIVRQSRAPLLASLFLSSNVNICGRAVAITSGGGACVLATGTTGTVISTTKNNLNIDLTGCGFFSNSSDPASISIQGNNDVIVAESIGTVGGAAVNGNLKTQMSVTTGNPPLTDPYAAEAASWPQSQTAVSPTIPTLPTIVTSGAGTGTAIPGACSGGKNGITTITLSAGNWSTTALSNAHLDKCTTINLSGGTYVFASSPSVSGATLNFQAASNIIVTSGNLITGTVVFSGGNYSIYVAAGGWSMGATAFGSGNYNIKIVGGDWTTSGTTTFGNGNYTIDVTTVAGTGGNWAVGGTTTFGTGTYNITLDALWTIGGATTNFGAGTYIVQTGTGWTISNATTIGNGNFNLTLGGDWTISQPTTFGSGNYTFRVTGGWTMSKAVTLGNGNYTFALTGDLTTSDNFTAGTGTYSGSMANWNITGTTTTIGKGIYYLTGNFNINGTGNSTVTANNVTLVLKGVTSLVNYTSNNSTFTLTAPLSGWNAGIAIWEPNSTVINPASNLLASGNNSVANITGVIYAPKADVQYMGNTGSLPNCTQIIAKSVEFGGNSINFTGDCGGVPGLITFGQIVALVE